MRACTSSTSCCCLASRRTIRSVTPSCMRSRSWAHAAKRCSMWVSASLRRRASSEVTRRSRSANSIRLASARRRSSVESAATDSARARARTRCSSAVRSSASSRINAASSSFALSSSPGSFFFFFFRRVTAQSYGLGHAQDDEGGCEGDRGRRQRAEGALRRAHQRLGGDRLVRAVLQLERSRDGCDSPAQRTDRGGQPALGKAEQAREGSREDGLATNLLRGGEGSGQERKRAPEEG